MKCFICCLFPRNLCWWLEALPHGPATLVAQVCERTIKKKVKLYTVTPEMTWTRGPQKSRHSQVHRSTDLSKMQGGSVPDCTGDVYQLLPVCDSPLLIRHHWRLLKNGLSQTTCFRQDATNAVQNRPLQRFMQACWPLCTSWRLHCYTLGVFDSDTSQSWIIYNLFI